jgi:mono/diheme cytochrome c family protein
MLVGVGTIAHAAAPLDYSRDVKPILEKNCFKCHGAEKQKGGLRLDRKVSALKGGDSGEPAIVPGNGVRSHLLQLVTTNDPDMAMPPKGDRLKAEEIATLQRWIEGGAHWVDGAAAQPVETLAANPEPVLTAQDRAFWSFVAPRASEPPPVKHAEWARNKIDRFVLAKMEVRGIAPTGEAARGTLVRRLSFDLTGLPPAPQEVAAFVADQRPDAYEQLVDRLLASPRFGERMASLWLPLARYAEDQAHQVGDDTKFFYPHAYKYRAWVMGAFNRDLPYDEFLKLQIAADLMAGGKRETASGGSESSDLVALGFLGLGPKYYNRGRLEVMADEWEDRVDTVTRTTLGLTVACARCHDHKFDPISQRDYYAMAGVFASTRMVNKTADGRVQKTNEKVMQWDPATLHIVEDGEAQDLNLFIRGNVDRKGPVVPRRFLNILSDGTPAPFTDGSGRRELAEAIANRSNPLTARVMVNRVWGMLLGRPIVVTPSNFGHSGQAPTHPELLDDLAVRFMDGGWSIKSLVREIVCSATYRQSARVDSESGRIDPANELYGRMSRRRLTIEQWRDSVLWASGKLKEEVGAHSFELDDIGDPHRTVYARVSRLKLNDLLMQFDYPDANVHAEGRSVTNTPIQKLFVMNSPFMIEQAKAFAARVLAEPARDDAERIARAYRLVFARDPSAAEVDLARGFLREPEAWEMSRWEEYAQVLLAANEALYVD